MKLLTKCSLILLLIITSIQTITAQILNTWVSGSNATRQNGVYGIKGVANAANMPGARYTCNSWTDASGNLWLFGGYGYQGSGTGTIQMNDLWKYNITSGQWTWLTGDSSTTIQKGVYGTKGVAASDNAPGGRQLAVTWTDASGNVWLFGGSGVGATSTSVGYLNDLWKYNPTTNQWTWVSGSSSTNQNGVYGTQGVANAANIPGGRNGSAVWTDASGNFWLLGGQGSPATGGVGPLNDLWKYNPSTNEWTWMGGNNTYNAVGIYGTLGTADAANMPGARYMGVNWTDNVGNFWLFGGTGYSVNTSSGSLNDLWKYDVSTSKWTWVSGDSTRSNTGVYGTMGTAASTNKPGGRQRATAFTDALGNFWLFGGLGYGASGSIGNLQDWWKYDVAAGKWTWIDGGYAINTNGVYGTQGTADGSNMPGGRYGANGWTDAAGNFWLFGGNAYGASGSATYINDFWKIATGITSLPVQIADITAQLQSNKSVVVNWTSITEVNLSSYNVQRSKDGSNFSTVGIEAAKGTSSYSYIDDLSTVGVLPATLYYRLEAIDKDGSKTYSKVVAVALGSSVAKTAINIYPNPVQATLYAQVTVSKAGAAQLRVVDAQGKVVATQKTQLAQGTTSVSIAATNLVAGNYVLEIEGVDGKQTQRFMKE